MWWSQLLLKTNAIGFMASPAWMQKRARKCIPSAFYWLKTWRQIKDPIYNRLWNSRSFVNSSSGFFRADNPDSFRKKKSNNLHCQRMSENIACHFCQLISFFIIANSAVSFIILVRLQSSYKKLWVIFFPCTLTFLFNLKSEYQVHCVM